MASYSEVISLPDFGSFINAAGSLAKEIGVSGAFIVILGVGIAFHLPRLAETVRLALKDWYDARRKGKELTFRIARETAQLDVELELRRHQIPNKRAIGKVPGEASKEGRLRK
jgi:hypothetical protein